MIRQVLRLLFAVSVLLTLASAQKYAVMPQPRLQFFDNSGIPLAGGLLFTYSAGTSSPLATYTDYTATTLNPNPVVLDSGGFATVWLGQSAYKFVLQNSAGVEQWSVDNVSIIAAPFVTSTINPAVGGMIRLAPTDTICWRNASLSADVCMSLDGSNRLAMSSGSGFALSGGITVASGGLDLAGLLTIRTGIAFDSTGFKHKNFGATTATAASAGATATTAYSWSSAFPDTNYDVICTGITATNVPSIVSVESRTTAGFSLKTVANTAAAASYAEVDCIGVHY